MTLQSPSGTNYLVSKSKLCEISKFFVKAFQGQFLEHDTKLLRFPDTADDTLKAFLYWLINGDLPNTMTLGDVDAEILLVQLWVFGDTYMIPVLQNAAMQVLARNDVQINVKTAQKIADSAPAGSALRSFMAHNVLWHETSRNDGWCGSEHWGLEKLGGILDLIEDDLKDRLWEGVKADAVRYHQASMESGEWGCVVPFLVVDTEQ